MSEDKQRKASDVLVELEKKLDLVLGFLRTQDLTIKLLSNKVNELSAQLSEVSSEDGPRPTVEAVNISGNQINPPNHTMMVPAANNLPMEQAPKGFRRTSRPETYAGDNSYLEPPKMPLQMPRQPPKSEVVVPDAAMKQKPPQPPQSQQPQQPQQPPQPPQQQPAKAGSSVNVEQRIVNREGKSVFLADVEVFNIDSGEKVHKSRTNGTGKWMASLPFGKYRVVIRKREPVTKANIEVNQEVVVDGTESPLKLQMMIFK